MDISSEATTWDLFFTIFSFEKNINYHKNNIIVRIN